MQVVLICGKFVITKDIFNFVSDELFANGKLSRVFTTFAIPSIFTSLLMISTFLVDGVLIGRFLGSEGLAAFNLVFPVFSFLVAFGIVIATGGSALVGKFWEKRKSTKPNKFLISQLF